MFAACPGNSLPSSHLEEARVLWVSYEQ